MNTILALIFFGFLSFSQSPVGTQPPNPQIQANKLPAPNIKPLPKSPYETIKKMESTVETNKEALHSIIRRIVVFPIETNGLYESEKDLAWWNIRQFLTDTQRFLVATKRYMSQRDTFQSRKAISPSDAILLGKILDSEALISTYFEKQTIQMQAYSTQDGFLLWKNSYPLNTSLPAGPQIDKICTKLIQDFITSMPYHGFEIVDPLIGTPTFEEGDVILTKVDVGAKSLIIPGESIQWIQIKRLNNLPLFQGGGQITVFAEGEVVKKELQTLLVEIKKTNDIKLLENRSLIASEMETKRMLDTYPLYDGQTKVNSTFLSTPLYPTQSKSEESKPLITALSSIGTLVAYLLLAL